MTVFTRTAHGAPVKALPNVFESLAGLHWRIGWSTEPNLQPHAVAGACGMRETDGVLKAVANRAEAIDRNAIDA